MITRLEQIKQYTTVNSDRQGDRYIVNKDDLHWLIERVEKLEDRCKTYEDKINRFEKVLKD